MQYKHPFFRFVICYGLILGAFFATVAVEVFRFGALRKDSGWEYELRSDAFFVSSVNQDGPAAGKLKTGDRIISINGNDKIGIVGTQGQPKILLPAEESYSLRIDRKGVQKEFQLSAPSQRDLHQLVSILLLYAAGLISYCTALFIGLSRPDQKATQLFALTWLTASVVQLIPVMTFLENFFGIQEVRLSYVIWFSSFSPITAAFAYHFYSWFPSGVRESRPWIVLKYIIYTWSGTLILFFSYMRLRLFLSAGQGVNSIVQHLPLVSIGLTLLNPLMLLSLPAICAAVIRNYKQLEDSDQRRRIRWVVYSSVIGTFPFMLYFGANLLRGLDPIFAFSEERLLRLFVTANLFLSIIPVSLAYVIVKHRMFNIQFVVRRGMQYLLARRFLQLLVYLPIAFIIYTIRANPTRSIPDLLSSNTSYIIVLIAAVAGLLFRKNVQEWLDRKFFREAYNSEKILLALVDHIKDLNTISEVSKWVSLQLDTALHPKQILVFYREEEHQGFSLDYTSGVQPPDVHIPDHFTLIRVAEAEGKSQDIYSTGGLQLPAVERDWLSKLGTQLVVPMTASNQRMVGLLLLGEKRSEEPYSNQDRKLLEALAAQMGMVYENVMLKDRVDHGQRIQREVLAHLSSQSKNVVKECPLCGTCFDSTEERCTRDQTELTLSLPVERIVDSKYRLDQLIGKGGMGAVYKATDLRLGREVAVKVMIGSAFGDHRALRRFEREARASARLMHPNIITIFDFGGIGEAAYLVMELLHGFTLRSALEHKGNIPPDVAAEWFKQIFDGMKAAHQQGIIHRDLKPENILITRDEKNRSLAKILDFGLAKVKLLDAPPSVSLTTPGTVLGTIHYMSPEQIVGGDVDERSDIFSLGVIVVEALTGERPFAGKSSTDVALAIIHKPFELLSEDLREFNTAIQKCLAKDRNKRYTSITEMAKELIPAIRNCPPFPAPLVTIKGDPAATDSIAF